jgi:rfaE bifunctional protein kinase chain/domain
MNMQRLREILARAKTKRILVIGDLMLDEFVWGKVGRISPEAPVPVVQVVGESFYPGGAANVARNLREFIAEVSVIGLVGSDRSGQQLRDLLSQQQINTADTVEDPAFQTIVKTRIIARNQQVVRVDREQVRALSPDQVSRIVDGVRNRMNEIDAIIFEDYGKGLLSTELVERICNDAIAAGKIVSSDPNPRNPITWKNLTAVKPNRSEAFQAAGVPWDDPSDPADQDEALAKVGDALLKKWGAKYVLITLGEQGMMLFQNDALPHHVPTKAQQVFDVSGAGDTAIALFTLALSCGATAQEAAEMANYGSAVVVGKLGTATVTEQELIETLQNDGLV